MAKLIGAPLTRARDSPAFGVTLTIEHAGQLEVQLEDEAPTIEGEPRSRSTIEYEAQLKVQLEDAAPTIERAEQPQVQLEEAAPAVENEAQLEDAVPAIECEAQVKVPSRKRNLWSMTRGPAEGQARGRGPDE